MSLSQLHPETELSFLVAIHLLIGFLTGAIFRVRALLSLVIIVLVECVATAAVSGVQAGLWSLTSLMAIQMGYLSGVYVRSALERAGLLAEPETQVKHTQ